MKKLLLLLGLYIKKNRRQYYDEAKRYPVMDAGQRVKIEKIAKKNSGNMQKAIKLIDKLKKGMSDNPDVMDILRKANEDVKEGVAVDRRTIGFKAAIVRNEVAKKVREKAELKKEKKKEQEVRDARYDYDGEVNTVLAAANKKIFGDNPKQKKIGGVFGVKLPKHMSIKGV